MSDASAPNPSTALARVVADELARCGVAHAVLAPGSRSTALALALDADDRIALHVEIDERSAGFLAIGIARASGVPAAVVTTSGSAVANLHPAVVESDTAAVPLLVLTTDRPPELHHTGANQTIEQAHLFGRAARWSVDVGVAEDRPGAVAYWRSTLSRAVAETAGLGGRPGPVQVNLAFREPTVPLTDDGRNQAAPFSQPLDGRADGRPWVDVHVPQRRSGDRRAIATFERLLEIERGLVVLGASRHDLSFLARFAAHVGWPVIAEPLGGLGAHDNRLRAYDAVLRSDTFRDQHRPEVVLRAGRTGLSRAVDAVLTADAEQVLLDPDGQWFDPTRTVREIVAEGPALPKLATIRGDARGRGAWLDAWLTADAAALTATDDMLDGDDEVSEPRTARDLVAGLPDGATLVVGSSLPIREVARFARPRDGVHVVANRGASGIDGFVSTTLGVALASGGPTVALCGDLTLLHDSNGFLLAPDAADLAVTFVVLNNDGGGIFHFLPQADQPGFERLFGTPHGRDLAKQAALHDLGHEAVAAADDLPAAVDRSIALGGINVVELRTDRAATRELHARIDAAVAAVLDA